jgi:hypothetical protein
MAAVLLQQMPPGVSLEETAGKEVGGTAPRADLPELRQRISARVGSGPTPALLL